MKNRTRSRIFAVSSTLEKMGAPFSISAFPEALRLEAMNGQFAQVSASAHAFGDTRPEFNGCFQFAASPLGICFLTVGSQCLRVVPRQEKDAGLLLTVLKSGQGTFFSENSLRPLNFGDIAYAPVNSSSSIAFESSFRAVFLYLPCHILDARLVSRPADSIGVIEATSGIGSVLSSSIITAASTLSRLASDDLRAIDSAILELFSSALNASAENKIRGETHSQSNILNRICQLIELHLSDPNFGPREAAERAGISERYMQKIFDSAGETFSHYIRFRRLERIRSDLVNARLSELSITEISYRAGFNDSAHFSRTFKEQYKVSPRDYRKNGLKDAAQAAGSPNRGWPAGAEKVLRRVAFSRAHEWLDAKDSIQNSSIASNDEPSRRVHFLPANSNNVHWGYLSKILRPALTVSSGDLIHVETLTHHANDDAMRMVEGDAGVESVFRWTPTEKSINRRGAGPLDAAISVFGRGAGDGIGTQICTGPIAVQDAEPGDVLEVKILDLKPRPSARFPGLAFGSNVAAWWGYQYNDLLTEPKAREVVTIYEMNCREFTEAQALYSYRWVPSTDPDGIFHPKMDYPGLPVDRSRVTEVRDVLKGVRIPLRPHFGFIGLAPKEAEVVDATPPSYNGGNLDNWRAGVGTSLFLPVSVAGALLSIGGPRASQGNAELGGTAIECSLNGIIQLVLHKRGKILRGMPVQDLDFPLLETPSEWVIHGFSNANYLMELGENAQSAIYAQPSLDPAMRDAFRKVRRFLMTVKGLTEDEAISLISVGVDFSVGQVVNGNLCIQASVRKSLFSDRHPVPDISSSGA